MSDLESIPQLRNYFEQLDRIAQGAGDAKLEALEPFIRSRAPSVAESLGWTVVAKNSESREPIRIAAQFGALTHPDDETSERTTPSRRARSNVFAPTAAALRGSVLKGAIRSLFAEDHLPEGNQYRLELETGEEASEMIASVVRRVHRTSLALTMQSGLELLAGYESGTLHWLLLIIAKEVINSSGRKVPVDLDGAAKDLANEVFKAVPKLREALGTPRLESEVLQLDGTASMLRVDAVFADFVADLGPRGQSIAQKVRAQSSERRHGGEEALALWADPSRMTGARWVEALTDAFWIDKVQPDLEREAERRSKNTEALAMPVHIEVARLHSRMGSPSKDAAQLVFEDGTAISFDSPLLDAGTIHLVSRGIELLGSIDAHRLLRWEVLSGYRKWIEHHPNPHITEVERGYGELAESLGIRDKGAPQRLRAILMAQRTCAFPLPGPGDATGNLIILSEWKGSGRRPGRIRIELGSALMPTYVHELAGSFDGRELANMQRLVPLAALPPFVGRERDHGAQATLSMLVTREMRVRAAELFRNGGIQVDLASWASLASEARIPRSQVSQQLKPILDRWTQDGDDGPAFLKRTPGDRDRYTLGDAHEAARRFLLEAGKREIEGSNAGKRSVKAREAKRERVGR